MKTIGCIGHDGDCCKTRDEDLKDAERWRWITRAGRTRGLKIPADESKASIDAAIDGQRLKQKELDAQESYAEKQAMYE